MRRFAAFAILAITLAAAFVRVAGIYDDFWLDEIWSHHIASNIATPDQIFLDPRSRFDNNHPLNTFFMWAIGHGPYVAVYRLPALAAGIASLIWAGMILGRRGMVALLVGTLVFGFSYPLILFSSEARGYALVVFFALVAFDALERFFESCGWIANIIFCTACVLGFLSHMTFIHFWIAAAAWSIFRWLKQGAGWGKALMLTLRLHLFPAAALAFLYFIFVRHLTIGGAPEQRRLAALRNALGGLLGAGDSTAAAIVLIALAGLLLVAALHHARKQSGDLWIFLTVAIVISPTVLVAGQHLLSQLPPPIAARYFLIPYTFFLLAVVLLLTNWLRTDEWKTPLASAVLGGFLVVNLYHTIMFLRIGRGNYHDAVTYMSDRTPVPLMTVLSDNQMRTAMVLNFYAQFLPSYQKMVIYDGTRVPTPMPHGPPMWIIVHSNKRGERPQEFRGYVFDREFPYYGLSGYSWYLYRNSALR